MHQPFILPHFCHGEYGLVYFQVTLVMLERSNSDLLSHGSLLTCSFQWIQSTSDFKSDDGAYFKHLFFFFFELRLKKKGKKKWKANKNKPPMQAFPLPLPLLPLTHLFLYGKSVLEKDEKFVYMILKKIK